LWNTVNVAREKMRKLCLLLKVWTGPGCWWLMPVIVAAQEAEIRRIVV
jgi:hypothetical protein